MEHFYRNITIDVSYFNEDSNGFVQKKDFKVFAAFDVSLRETLQEFLPVNLREAGFLCKGGNFMGEPIDLEKTPVQVDYITDRYKLGNVATLFLFESGTSLDVEKRKRSTNVKHQSASIPRRRPSVMVKRALETRDSGLSLDGSISSFFDTPTASTSDRNQSESSTHNISIAVPKNVEVDFDIGPELVSLDNKSDQDEEQPVKVECLSSGSESDDAFSSEISTRVPPQKRQVQQLASAPSAPDFLPLLPPPSTPNNVLTSDQKSNKIVRIKSPLKSPKSPDKSGTLPANRGGIKRHSRLESTPDLPSPSRAATLLPHNHKSPLLGPVDKSVFVRKRVIRVKSIENLHKLPYVLKLTIDHPNGNGTSDNWSTVIPCDNFTTVGELGQLVNRALLKHGKMESANPSLVYIIDGQKCELFNEAQFLQNTNFYAQLMKGHSTDDVGSDDLPQLMVTFARDLPYREMATYYRISQLTGILLDVRVAVMGSGKFGPRILPVDMCEAVYARRTLHDYMVQVTDERDEEDYALSTEVITADAPTILTLKIPVGNQISVTFHYKDEFSFTQKVGIHDYASDILSQIFPCLVACRLVKDQIEEYTLKISGEECFIHGSVELIAFKAIRRSIVKGEPIHLSVASRPSTELYKRFNSSWLLLDSFTCKAQSHVEVSKFSQPSIQSAWDCNKDFELEVSRVENLPFSGKSDNKISVEVSLHLGAKLIHTAKNTGWLRQNNYAIHCNKKETFFIKIKNIPKGAKVLVLVRSSTSKVFYWGLISVYDHLGRFRSGTHILHLWKSKSSRDSFKNTTTSLIEDEVAADKLHSFLAGPVSNNPCSSAVRATINFGVHEQPIYYPSTSKRSVDKFFDRHRAIRCAYIRRYLSKYMPGQSSSKSFKNLANDLHRGVNWTDFTHCLEVYNLLEVLKCDLTYIREHVGLQLLDSNFPDEAVRTFAVHVLKSKLSDESLEAYLLQLTQALKFEPNHDSALARYLLKKALTNKRIGHFFFWYLKSEIRDLSVKCSPCTLRFAVILEAYLKGCGEAMMTRFVDQVEIERVLTEIRLKLHGPDQPGKGDVEKMQESLHTELKKMELQKYSFYPVFNPRLKMGKMRIDKCKIIGSAKRPMWLELLNADATALNKAPVRVIFKTGDDLRQDMITLRMFGLFENLWENEGMDLRLIPYGCMATGMNSGFIEVVKNAKTIKEVSGVRENHKLFEWIKSHQKNEFGEEDPEKVKQAIKTFIHSCAGYSVATYILGIGDRHNDNIMVTTSGNLFHIDFGHFLGNIKHFMGFKKEWAPFVLTPDFVYVMGGEGSANFEYYKNLCCRAFLILRRNAELIINLIAMMRSTGIPELTCVEDTDYVRNALALDKTDTEAEQCFKNVIKKCLSLTWTVQVVWAAHIVINGSRLNKSES